MQADTPVPPSPRPTGARPVETQRIDAFVDASFAFAVTLLVIAGAEPLTGFDDLLRALGRIPAFAGGFALVVLFWLAHRSYGRLATIRDGWATALSLAVVFTVLIYVFPLRVLMEGAMVFFSGGRLPGGELIASVSHLRAAYVVYGLGFAFLALLYALLFAHGLRRPLACGLADADRREAAEARDTWVMITVVGVLSALEAWLLPLAVAPWAPGFTYWLIPLGIYGLHRLRRRRDAPASATDAP